MVAKTDFKKECYKGNFISRTTLTNRNLVYRNIDFGDGSLNSIYNILINGVETIQVVPKLKKISIW